MRKLMILAVLALVVSLLSVLPAGQTSASHLDGLVAYWPFDESSGTTAFDAAHDNHGTITNATHECADMAPVLGNACSLDFNGTTAVVEAANESNFDLTDLSISFWFKLKGDASANDYPRPVSKGNSTTMDGGYSIWVKDVSDPTDIGMGLADTFGTRHDARDLTLPNYDDDGGWHHVVGTYDSAAHEAKLYVDGTLEATNTDVFTLRDVDNPFSIGAPVGTLDNPVASRFFNGLIDEVCVWNRALSTSEIATYASGVPCVIEVDIDIKPGSDLNCINPDGHGVIPVAILTTEDFDASTVDPFTVTLEGSGVRVKGKSGNAGSLEDADGDGDLDLIVHITDDSVLTGLGTATLTGVTFDRQAVAGTDSICIVPPE